MVSAAKRRVAMNIKTISMQIFYRVKGIKNAL
jgi:hypothetical protein